MKNIKTKTLRKFDRYCIIKQCAKNLLKDYGLRAYKAFIKVNPKANLSKSILEKYE